jgi:phage repressor protein C with HTH and peptisase S24 domain
VSYSLQGADVRKWRENAGMTQDQAAAYLGIAREWLSKVENDRAPVSGNVTLKIQQHRREEDFTRRQNQSQSTSSSPSDELIREDGFFYGGHQIPVLSWARAGQATTYEEIPADWQERIFTECRDEKAFGIQIEGDSMLPDFRPGDVVIVMPSHEPRNHAPVVAKLKNDGVVLKILNLTGRDGHTIRLTSINPVYQPTDYTADDFHWIYPVHSARRMYWR